jgi:hypothetical protein
MATRDQVYAKFGITAEAAQLFETDLNTLLLAAHGLDEGWHVQPNPERAKQLADRLDASTLGMLLKRLNDKSPVQIDDALKERFTSAMKARNRLIHGFYERHNVCIQTDEGCNKMIADLEELHTELFEAWQLAHAMMTILTEHVKKHATERI